MPKTHRDLIKRKLAQAYININWAGKYLLQLKQEFDPIHPEIGQYLEEALEGLAIETDILTHIAKNITGAEQINWQAWAATGRPTQPLDSGNDYIEENNLPPINEEQVSHDADTEKS